jgi:hypothetical protein
MIKGIENLSMTYGHTLTAVAVYATVRL